MKPGRASQTAVLVCMERAAAHGDPRALRFSDPTALALLPDDARARVERFRAGTPLGMRERFEHGSLARSAEIMVVRTVAIDDAVRAACAPQLVILGAGLDGRAWRMPELRDVTVYEVDHPDSQRDKRDRAARLPKVAHEVHFVPVDFERDDLGEALAFAGHDPARPTSWVWEGVVMYLTPADVEATLAAVARRSAPGSRLVVSYDAPALRRTLVRLVVRWFGEPMRSAFTPNEVRSLLRRHGFEVLGDQSLATIGAALSDDLGRAARLMTFHRIAIAERRAGG